MLKTKNYVITSYSIHYTKLYDDFVGFIFSKSKRQISKETAKDLSESLSDKIKTVGVFVNEPIEIVAETVKVANLDVIQLHGDENEFYINSYNFV